MRKHVIEKLSKIKTPGRPQVWGVVYSAPNPDDSSKACKNCLMWIRSLEQCEFYDYDVTITDSHFCNRHVYGKPHEDRINEPGIDLQVVDPSYSGLRYIPGGVSCDTCRFYLDENERKRCRAVIDGKGSPAVIHAKGHCARWQD